MSSIKELRDIVYKLNNNSYPAVSKEGSYHVYSGGDYLKLVYVKNREEVILFKERKEKTSKQHLICFIKGFMLNGR